MFYIETDFRPEINSFDSQLPIRGETVLNPDASHAKYDAMIISSRMARIAVFDPVHGFQPKNGADLESMNRIIVQGRIVSRALGVRMPGANGIIELSKPWPLTSFSNGEVLYMLPLTQTSSSLHGLRIAGVCGAVVMLYTELLIFPSHFRNGISDWFITGTF